MFRAVRIKLTAWYLLIICIVSLLFSVVLYKIGIAELMRFDHFQQIRIQHEIQQRSGLPQEIQSQLPPPPLYDPSLLLEAREHLLFILVSVDAGILILSAVVGYFLAGRTLDPIRKMMDEQNRFVADASHELRTPLTALKSSIEVNLRDKKLSVEDARQLLTSNLEEVNQLQFLSDALLELAQYEQSSVRAYEKKTIASIVGDAVKKSEPLARQKEITLKTELTDTEVEGNTTALSELLFILLENAVKYSAEKTTVTVQTQKMDGHIKVCVQDQGMGISAKDLPHIFDRFYRADASRSKTQVNGYGLGLAIAKKIVESHHGTITVLQTSEKGTTFCVELPIKHT